jgi:hypothetical protein
MQTESPAETFEDDSLLRLIRAVWLIRRWILLLIVAGGVCGFFSNWQRPARQTSAIIRWMSPGTSYTSTGYWELLGRIRQSQLQGLAGSLGNSQMISLRTQKDPWLLRIDVLHDKEQSGSETIKTLLAKLQALDSELSTGLGGVSNHLQISEQLVGKLAELNIALNELGAAQVDDQLNPPIDRLPTQIHMDGSPRLPLASTPWFPWYTRLKQRANLLLATEGIQKKIPQQIRVVRLTEESAALLLRHWCSLDLMASTAELPRWRLESVTELEINTAQRLLRDVGAGMWIAATIAVLGAVPVKWWVENWARVIRE